MIQSLLFPETIGFKDFDPAKTKMTVADLVAEFKKKEAKEFEEQNKYNRDSKLVAS